MHTTRLPRPRATAGLAVVAVVAAGLTCLAPTAHAAPTGFPAELAFAPADLAAADDEVFAVGSVIVEADEGEIEANGYLAALGSDRVMDLGPGTTAYQVAATADGENVYVMGSSRDAGSYRDVVWAVDTVEWQFEVARTFGTDDSLAGITLGPEEALLAYGSSDSSGAAWGGPELDEDLPMPADFVPHALEVVGDPETDTIVGFAAGVISGEAGASTPSLQRLGAEAWAPVDLDDDITELSGLAVDPISGTAYVGTRIDNPGAGEDEPSTLDALTVVSDDTVSRVDLHSDPRVLDLSADGDTLYAPDGYSLLALDTAALGSYDDDNQPPATYLPDYVSTLVVGGDDRVYAAAGEQVHAVGAPSAPTGFTANADFANRLEVSWTASADAGGVERDELSYTVTVQDRAGGAPVRKDRLASTEYLYGFLGVDVLPGHTYDVSVVATNGAFTSAAATATLTVPTPVAAPSAIAVVGSMKVGSRLSVRNVGGAWAPGTTLAYHWILDERSTGSRAATFTLTPAHLGKRVSLSVTGTKAGFAETTLWTVPVKVTAGTLKKATPKIAGKAKVGQKLTAKAGTWTAGTTLRYRWTANGKAIKGGTGKTLKLKAAQAGKRITVKVTGTKAGYTSATATSKKTAKVAKAKRAKRRR